MIVAASVVGMPRGALVLTGPASTRVVLHRVGGTILVEDPATAPEPAAQVTSSTFDFLAWSTTRTPWREVTEVTDDVSVAAAFLDELNLVRRLGSGSAVPRTTGRGTAGGSVSAFAIRWETCRTRPGTRG
ncbi:hypothetical protein GCM10011578_009350 [Streptomyces fuscichromogenes]|uniref:Uncharacterized protein n=1 Tax=Streptomyces fuscichromogenes TaxID=1324013 RepID=A0A917X8W9_9ACTN|nr:hypothetical protein GCM10011578_009350 [Streptomyces fuscichromogenes]